MAEKKLSFDAGLVKSLADILNETNLTEIEVEQGEMRVRVSREPAPQIIHAAAPQSMPSQQYAPAPAAPAASAAPAAAAPASDGNEVPSPMVGTVYFSPAPGEPPFIQIGDKVTEGQTLVIIEAMKVMNQIPAPRSGIVKEMRVEDGEAVEYGQPLLVIA